MCGIAGIVDLKAARDIDREALKRMTDAVRHRGPDDEDYFYAPGVGFGHRRLAIIDVEGGAQPFRTASGDGALTYNGEIYNYCALAQSLSESGVSVVTRSDTEVLAEGFAMEGAAFIHKLRGMFAFAFWDIGRERVTLARDRLGEKPLYYALTDNGFLLFASEIGAIAASGLVDLDFDMEAIADYFLYGFIPDPKSIYRTIRKLPPGSILTARRGGEATVERYWRPEFQTESRLDFAAACEELRAQLDDAVQSQLVADAPLGAFLSGGVDSSAIVASMAQTRDEIRTCSIGFDEASHDERRFARLVAQRFNTVHVDEAVHVDAAAMVDEIARVYGEPFADSSALPTYLVSKLARQSVKVALTGDGGDEVFAGYRRHKFFLREERLRNALPPGFRRATLGAAGALYPKLDWAPRPMRLKSTLQSLALGRAEAYAHALAANLPTRAASMLSPELRESLGGYRPESVIEDAMGAADEHPLIAAQRADLAVWLPGRMLTKVDRASMAHGLEARPPLLDYRLVEWAGALDLSFKLSGGDGKRILKAAMAPRLPPEILHRKKQGFGLPVAAWLRAPDGPLAALSRSAAWRQCGLLNTKAVDGMIANHLKGAADCSQELWTVIMFDAFLRAARNPASA